MATNTNANWGKKGNFFGKFILYSVLFIVMLVWIYKLNLVGV